MTLRQMPNVYLTLNWSQVGTSNIPNPDMWLGALPGVAGGTSQSIGQEVA